jgi:hypothetical protein
MALMDKLKGIGRALTGSGAKVTVSADSGTIAAPFTVRITATVADADLAIRGVYLLVRAQEIVRLDSGEVERSIRAKIHDFQADGRLNGITSTETTCDMRIQVAGADTLKAGQTYTWDGTVKLPPTSAPTFNGRNAQHVWQVQAGLDATGNDPDSGWVTLHVV